MSQENVERIRGVYEAIARRDPGAIEALIEAYPPAPGFEFESGLTGQVYRGTQAVLNLVTDLWETVGAVPEMEEIIDAGDHVILVLRVSGRGMRSGVPVTQQMGVVWTYDRETLVGGKSFASRTAALEAVGLRE